MEKDETIAIINDKGRCMAQFAGIGARGDAEGFIADCQKGNVQHMRGTKIVDGRDAERVIKTGHI